MLPRLEFGQRVRIRIVTVLGRDEALEIHVADVTPGPNYIDWLIVSADQAQAAPPDPGRWRALGVCLIAGAMTLLDLSIVNVALPTLRSGLGADDSDVQWIVAGYALAFGVFLVPSGRLGDARSRRAVFVAGVALFTLASAAAGAAPNPTLLAIARVVQGIGGGMIAPQVSGFIQNLFRGAERARAFGLFGCHGRHLHRDRAAARRAAGQPGWT